MHDSTPARESTVVAGASTPIDPDGPAGEASGMIEPLPSPPPSLPAAARSPWRRRMLLAVRLAVIAAVVVGLGFFLRGMHLDELGRALRQARPWPIAVAALLSFGILLCKATCWQIMLAPVTRVPVLWLFRYTIAAYAASALTPARGGEVLRLWLLKHRDGVPVATSAAVAIGDKLLDVCAMFAVLAPVPWLLPDLPEWVGRSLLLLLALGLALILAGRIAIARPHPGRLLGRFSAGFAVLRRPSTFALALLALVAAWLLDLTAVNLVFYALGLELPVAAAMLVLLTVNLAIAVPSTPGQVGVLEFGAMVGLQMLGVDRERGLAFALLYHGMQVVPLVSVALLDLRLVITTRRGALAEQARARPE
jgi:glycosyltransferase 2 family protein